MEDRTFIVRPNGSDAIVCFECYILFLIDQIENRDLVLTQDAQSFTIAGCVNKTCVLSCLKFQFHIMQAWRAC